MNNHREKLRQVAIITILAIGAVLLSLTPETYAIAILKLSDGTSTAIIADGASVGDTVAGLTVTHDDASLIAGVVGFNSNLGSFFVNMTTGIGSPVLGTPQLPEIDLNSINLSSGSGILTLELTQTDNQAPGPLGFEFNIGGTTDGIVTASAYLDTTNATFGKGETLASTPALGPKAFAYSSSTSITAPVSDYSLTIVVTIDHSALSSVHNTSFDAELQPVPEPGTFLLLGMGVVGLIGYRKSRHNS